MAKSKESKKAKSKDSEIDSNYHDIEQVKKDKIDRKDFDKQLRKLDIELVKLQEWVKAKKLKVVVVFEGRDAAGRVG
jgi:polyphosphate kinase 2 (PPK2 family)